MDDEPRLICEDCGAEVVVKSITRTTELYSEIGEVYADGIIWWVSGGRNEFTSETISKQCSCMCKECPWEYNSTADTVHRKEKQQ